MAAALPFLMIAGSVMSAVGALQQGQAAKSAADYNSTIATQNSAIARQNAADKARQADRETYLRLGSIRANQGASGGNSGEGSVLDVIGDVAAQSELERQQIIYQGELQARGYQNEATLDTFSGETQQKASYWKAGSELLSGASKAYSASGSLTRS
jgi:hypothetical protein